MCQLILKWSKKKKSTLLQENLNLVMKEKRFLNEK